MKQKQKQKKKTKQSLKQKDEEISSNPSTSADLVAYGILDLFPDNRLRKRLIAFNYEQAIKRAERFINDTNINKVVKFACIYNKLATMTNNLPNYDYQYIKGIKYGKEDIFVPIIFTINQIAKTTSA